MLTIELDTGVVIRQVTQETRLVSNIYCERPFCSADSARFLYARQLNGGGHTDRSDWEYVLCEFGSFEETVVGRGNLSVSISYDNGFYYQVDREDKRSDVIRIDLATGKSETVWSSPGDLPYAKHPAISADAKRMAFSIVHSYQPQRFGVVVVDLETGQHDVIHEDSECGNPHLQFCPVDANLLMVQVNRGIKFSPDGRITQSTDERGATLHLLNATTGDVEPLQIGLPCTPPITGHETWLGESDNIVATVLPRVGYEPEPGKGNVVTVRRGEKPVQLGTGIMLNHIGCTPCGSYIYGDTIEHDRIAIINPKTGKSVTVYEDKTQPNESPFGQQSHPHAYLTPDFKWMVFNSDRTGLPQTYVAEIPQVILP